MLQVTAIHFAGEQSREQDRNHEHDKEDNNLQAHDLREGFQERSDGDFKALLSLDQAQRSQDSRNTQYFDELNVRVGDCQADQCEYDDDEVEDVPSVAQVAVPPVENEAKSDDLEKGFSGEDYGHCDVNDAYSLHRLTRWVLKRIFERQSQR